MKESRIMHIGMVNQQLVAPSFALPTEVVRWMGGVQAQEFSAAKCAVGCRTIKTTDRDIEQSCSNGEILRVHLLRPTWHFILPEDIHWMLPIGTRKIRTLSIPYHKKLGTTAKILTKPNTFS
jgi:Winged helix DNA-binding domain